MDADRIARKVTARLMGVPEGQSLYTFHRAEGFYPLALKDDEDAKVNAFCNPGTLKVVNEMTGETVWSTES